MKKLSTLFLLLFPFCWLFASCGEKEDPLTTKHTVKNNTGFTVDIVSRVDGQKETIADGQAKTFKSKTSVIGLFDASSAQTQKQFNYRDEGNNTYSLYSYEYDIEYRVTGQGGAKTASLTWATPDGQTGQSTRTLPTSVSYRVFEKSFLYISAQNNQSSGCVTVEIYKKDSKAQSKDACGAYAIATASN